MSDIEKELKRLRDERQKKFNEEDWDGALEIHDQILKLSPSALRYANRGSILYRMGRLEEAIESYRKALEMDPELKRARADLERLEAQLQKKKEKKGPLTPPSSIVSESLEEETPPKRSREEEERHGQIEALRDARQKYLDEENWAEAAKINTKILEIEPTGLRYANQGSMMYRMGKLAEAIECYKKALEMDPSMEKARTDLERLESQLEEEKLLSSVKEHKSDVKSEIESLRKLRQDRINAEDWEGALSLHDEILEKEPTGLRYANRGSILYRLGKFEEALRSYQKALEMDPSLTKLTEDIKRLESQLEEEKLIPLESGEKKKESDLSPEEKAEKIAYLKEERQKYLDAKEWDKALQYQDEMIALEPTALRYVNRGSMLYRMGRLEDAIETYKKALEMDPNMGRARADLTRMEKEFSESKAKEEPKEEMEEIEELPPLEEKPKKVEKEKTPRAKPALSEEEKTKKMEELKERRQAAIEREDWESAVQVYNEMVELEPSASRFASRGSLLYKIGKMNEAILSYRKAIDLDSQCEEAQDALEALQESEMERLRNDRYQKMQENKLSEALKIHDVILALEPSALRYANRGSLLYQMGRLADAIEAYKIALKMDPNLEKAQEDLSNLEKEMQSPALVEVPKEFEEDEDEIFQAEPIGEVEQESHVEEAPKKQKAKSKEETLCKGTLKGHEGEISCILVTADGKTLISGSKDKTIRVWDLDTQKCLHVLEGHQDWVRSLAISNDGAKVVSGSDDWTIRVWDMKSGKCDNTIEGHTMPVVVVAISANSRFIFSGSRDRTIKIWDTKSGKCLSTLDGHQDWISCFVLSQDGNKAISGSYDNTIKIWNVLGWRCMNTLEGHQGWVKKLLLTPDGKQVISLGHDRAIKIWDMASGKCVKSLEGHADQIMDIQISNNGKYMVSSGRDQSVLLWNLETYESKNAFSGSLARFEKVSIASESLMFSSTDSNRIYAWKIEELNKCKILEGHDRAISCLLSFKEKDWLVSGSADHTLKIWDCSSLLNG